MISYMIEIIEVESGEAYYSQKMDYGSAVTHCQDGKEETGDEYTHNFYVIH